MLIQNFGYDQALRSIREIVLDVGLVQSFKVSGLDLAIKKTLEEVRVGDTVKPIGLYEVEKLYDLVALMVEKGLTVEILPDYVATEYVTGLINFDIPNVNNPETGHIIKAKNYFTSESIESVMVDYFASTMSYDGQDRTTRLIYDSIHYMERRKMILWVAFFLIDKRRMQMASTSNLIAMAGGDSCGGGEFKNTNIDTTTRVGDVFTEMEKTDESGNGLEGFTSLWGDKYSYLTKLQLYIRSMFEKQFGDYSLRDNAMISQTFSMDKQWERSSWINPHLWTADTYGVLVDNRE